MKNPKPKLLTGAVVSLLIGLSVAAGNLASPTILAAASHGANPCAANPCAPKNPCGARNPCAANPCAPKNPCAANPCAAAPAAKLSNAQASAAYKRILATLQAGYAKSGDPVATAYIDWKRYNKSPYVSDTHGGRFVNNFANDVAGTYGRFEKAGVMPVGSVIAKNSFGVTPQGRVQPGPLFIMEKMAAGFNSKDGDWRYTMIMPTGAVYGTSKGKNASKVGFCAECHNTVLKEQDALFFLPEEYRVSR